MHFVKLQAKKGGNLLSLVPVHFFGNSNVLPLSLEKDKGKVADRTIESYKILSCPFAFDRQTLSHL